MVVVDKPLVAKISRKEMPLLTVKLLTPHEKIVCKQLILFMRTRTCPFTSFKGGKCARFVCGWDRLYKNY